MAHQPASIPATTSCPPGLEYLTQIDKVLIKQVVERCKFFRGCESNNKYRVLNTEGQQVFFIQEEKSSWMQRHCAGSCRGFILHVSDNNNQEVVRIVREFKCCAGWCCCAKAGTYCSLELQVEAPVGQVVGFVRQERSFLKPKLSLYDADKQMVGLLGGPWCVHNAPCFGNVEFPVTDPTGQHEIGMCAKRWTGALREYFTDADNLQITFPIDMDVRVKALMFGAMMMVDFMYFERQKRKNVCTRHESNKGCAFSAARQYAYRHM